LLIGLEAKKKGIDEAILDIGLQRSTKGSAIYALVKGAIDAGLKIPVDEKMFPSEERIRGEHIARYAQQLKDNKEMYSRQFLIYIKNGIEPEKIVDHFNEVKKKILEA
jgi:large subunit ribosomal protein L18